MAGCQESCEGARSHDHRWATSNARCWVSARDLQLCQDLLRPQRTDKWTFRQPSCCAEGARAASLLSTPPMGMAQRCTSMRNASPMTPKAVARSRRPHRHLLRYDDDDLFSAGRLRCIRRHLRCITECERVAHSPGLLPQQSTTVWVMQTDGLKDHGDCLSAPGWRARRARPPVSTKSLQRLLKSLRACGRSESRPHAISKKMIAAVEARGWFQSHRFSAMVIVAANLSR